MSSSNLLYRALAWFHELLSPQFSQAAQARQLKLLIALYLLLILTYNGFLLVFSPDQGSRLYTLPIWLAALVPSIVLLQLRLNRVAIHTFLFSGGVAVALVAMSADGIHFVEALILIFLTAVTCRLSWQSERKLLNARQELDERRHAEQALRESEAKFRSFFEIAPSGISIVDGGGRFVDVNPMFLQTINLPREAVIGRTTDELGLVLGTPEHRQRMRERLQAAELLNNEEVQVIYPDARVGVALYSARATRIGGEPHTLTVLTDITDRKSAETEIRGLNTELQQRASYLRTLNDIARAVTALTDMDSTLRNIMTQLAGIVPFDTFYVGLSDDENGIIRFPIMYDAGQYWDQPDLPLEKSAIIAEVLATGQPALMNRTPEEMEAFVDSSLLLGDIKKVSASRIFVPLSLGERAIGVMSIQSYTLNAYQQKHVDLLMSAALSVSIAIDNANLYDNLQLELAQRKQLEAELKRYTAQLEEMVQERTAQLQHAKAQIEIILNNTSDAIALAGPNGDILARNPAFVAMFGEKVANCIEHLLRMMPEDTHGIAAGCALMDVLWDHMPQRVEVQIADERGGTKDIDLALIPVRLSESEERPGILVSAHDITHLKEIERFKARFIDDAVHDLATPITGLTTRLFLLKRTPEKLDDHVRAISNQVDHLRNLLSDLRTLSLIDQHNLTLEWQRCDLNEVAQRVFDTYEPVAFSNNQTLRLIADPTLPAIVADGRRIERALVNLVSNAINYTPEGKTILIQTACEDQRVTLAVQDEGMGIGAEELSRVFDRFYRTDSARSIQSGGTGLGLAIAKEIIELHGGSITVESALGVGSTFVVRLPIENS